MGIHIFTFNNEIYTLTKFIKKLINLIVVLKNIKMF
jgi:hypothetical protein